MYALAIAQMLSRDREEWAALLATLDSHPGGKVHDPESPEWETRHVYAHLARWINNSTDDLEAVLEGRSQPSPPEGDDDAINARWRAEDDGISFEHARQLALNAYKRRMRLIEAVPAKRWDSLLVAIAHADGYRHYADHRHGIEHAAKPT